LNHFGFLGLFLFRGFCFFSAHAFQQALASNKIQTLVSEFVSTMSMNDDNSINTASEKLENIFSQAAEMSLKKQKPRNKNKPKNPKWFNGNLQQHIEHICTFFVTFFSATIDGRDLIFGHKLHIGTPYREKRFWIHQIPTSIS
jgi:hypothetical protein